MTNLPKSPQQYYKVMLNFLNTYKQNAQLGPIINQDFCNKKKESIEESIKLAIAPNSFWLEMNLDKMEVTWGAGLEKIGYDDSKIGCALTLKKYFHSIHEDFHPIYLQLSQQAYEISINNREVIDPQNRDHSYTKTLPFYNQKLGIYQIIEQTASPLGMDANNNIITHLNHYHITTLPFDPNNFTMMTSFGNPQLFGKNQQQVLYENVLPDLTPKLKQLLNCFLESPITNLKEALEVWNNKHEPTTYDALKKQNTRLLEKFRPIGNFSSTKELADFLKRNGIHKMSLGE